MCSVDKREHSSACPINNIPKYTVGSGRGSAYSKYPKLLTKFSNDNWYNSIIPANNAEVGVPKS